PTSIRWRPCAMNDRIHFRRRVHQIEHDLLVQGTPGTGDEVETALMPLAQHLGPQQVDQVIALSRLAAGQAPSAYLDDYGCAGVRRFRTRGGATLYLLMAETLPELVNNIYLIVEDGKPRRLTLFDAGSQFKQSQDDLARARGVLAKVYGEDGILDQVRD